MKKISTLKKIIFFGFVIIILSFIFLRYFFYEAPILTYHRISSFCFDTPLLCVSPQSFKRQMDFIARHGYQVISLEELVNALSRKKNLPRKTVVITFDDGTEDVYQYGFPILKKHGFPATIFVISHSMGRPGFLSWGQINEMQRSGIDIGSHTKTHVFLPKVDDKKLWQEIFESKQEIQSRLGKEVTLFSYPMGGFNPQAQFFLKKSGYKGACTTNRGRYNIRADVFALRRIKMTDDSDNPLVMWVKLSGIYNLFRRK